MFGNASQNNSIIGKRSIAETVALGEISRKKMNKIGKPKLVKTFKNLISDENELMQESNIQMIMVIPMDIFESNQELKRFFDEYTATTLCNAQRQLAALKITGYAGGIVKENCKGNKLMV